MQMTGGLPQNIGGLAELGKDQSLGLRVAVRARLEPDTGLQHGTAPCLHLRPHDGSPCRCKGRRRPHRQPGRAGKSGGHDVCFFLVGSSNVALSLLVSMA